MTVKFTCKGCKNDFEVDAPEYCAGCAEARRSVAKIKRAHQKIMDALDDIGYDYEGHYDDENMVDEEDANKSLDEFLSSLG